jgi:uncharacterized protein YneF (UPF0154 family)
MNPVLFAYIIIGILLGALFIYLKFFEKNLKDRNK